MDYQDILNKLPYSEPFLFVDGLLHVDENGVTGHYTYDAALDFYRGHFVGHPVTPGVILTETMAQIGLVCLGIFLLNDEITSNSLIALTSSEIEFLKPVYPNEKVTVVSEKLYFRFNKLKCRVSMTDSSGTEVCRGTIAGIINHPTNV